MDTVSDLDTVQLANKLASRCQLKQRIEKAHQCSSDFLLLLYYSIMGELPVGVLVESKSAQSQRHNVLCVIETLSNDYLHVDLSHISPYCYVNGDPTTIYNLLEIMDGLLEFMMDQISDSAADDGDIDSDRNSERSWSTIEKDDRMHVFDTSINSEELGGDNSVEFVPLPVSSESPVTSGSDYQNLPDKLHLLEVIDDDDEKYQEQPEHPHHIKQAAEHPYEIETHDVSCEDSGKSLSEYTTEESECDVTITESPTSWVKLESNMTYSINKPSDSILSNNDKKEERQVKSVLPRFDRLSSQSSIDEQYLRSGSCSGVDDADGIPKPDLQKGGTSPPQRQDAVTDEELDVTNRTSATEEFEDTSSQQSLPVYHPLPSSTSAKTDDVTVDGVTVDTEEETVGLHPVETHDWDQLLENLQTTIEESQRIREKYYNSPGKNNDTSETNDDTTVTAAERNEATTTAADNRRKRNVRFEDTVSTATRAELEGFRQLLQKEKQLAQIKTKMLERGYQDHLDEITEAEQDRLQPLATQVQNKQANMKSLLSHYREKHQATLRGKQRQITKDLAEAAKWKSWQAPVVHYTTPRRGKPARKKLKQNEMSIGEHDLLPLLMDEFPGLQLSKTTLNNAWQKQFRQIEAITNNETHHQQMKRNSEKELRQAHERHQLLTDILRKEHEHTIRQREAKVISEEKVAAKQKTRDKRQQSARIRRYYRDYQIQMRSKMLKRRTKEEMLFKNLFEEGLHIQRCRLRELQRYARDKRLQQQQRQYNEVISLENYYKDQFNLLAEALEKEKDDLHVRDAAQTKLLRQMKRGLREKMEREIVELQSRIVRDDEDTYLRDLEADRVRRSLQLATYHSKFKPPM